MFMDYSCSFNENDAEGIKTNNGASHHRKSSVLTFN